MVELVYKFDEKSYHECLKDESIAKVRFNFFGPQMYINIIWTPTPITLPRSRCACKCVCEVITAKLKVYLHKKHMSIKTL